MRHILVLNSKGGCGKSTIATGVASYYADAGYNVALADFDPQASSLDWVARRPEKRAPIAPVAAFEDGLRRVPRKADIVVLDAPASSRGRELKAMIKRSQTMIVPILPSVTDMSAANRFLHELNKIGRVKKRKIRIAVVANRVRESTCIFEELDEYLEKKKIPYLTALRDSQNYIRAYERGIGIYEMPEYLAAVDWEQWDPLIEWLDSRRSRPKT